MQFALGPVAFRYWFSADPGSTDYLAYLQPMGKVLKAVAEKRYGPYHAATLNFCIVPVLTDRHNASVILFMGFHHRHLGGLL
jgi:hypothetical protein